MLVVHSFFLRGREKTSKQTHFIQSAAAAQISQQTNTQLAIDGQPITWYL
jgi:hypothetical protein